MLKITPDPPHDGSFVPAPGVDLMNNQAAIARALSFYLPDTPPPPVNSDAEEALVHASSLLRCASVSAVEASNHLDGTQRDLVLSVLHLVDMARTQVEKSLSSLNPR